MFKRFGRKIADLRIYHLVLLLIGAGLVLNSYCDEEAMLGRQVALQKKIWRTEVNDMLYRNLIDIKTDGLIVTDYEGVKYLPGFEARAIIADLESVAELTKGISLPGVEYVLIRPVKPSKLDDFLTDRATAGAFRPIAAAKGFSLIKVR